MSRLGVSAPPPHSNVVAPQVIASSGRPTNAMVPTGSGEVQVSRPQVEF